jgi:P27 family predicted phage terminase small subunit
MSGHGIGPRPNEEKRRLGTPPSRLNPPAPTPRDGALRMPPGMSPGARRAFRLVRDEMPAGQIANADQAVLRSFCEIAAQQVAGFRRLAEDGPLVVGAGGRPGKSPYVSLTLEWSAELRLLAGELGLSPRARRAIAAELGEADPMQSMYDVIGPPPRLAILARQREEEGAP